MENRNLLSSVALFSELYNNSNKDIYDIIGDFIIGICVIESKFSFTSNELKNLMESSYGFEIPEAVLRTVLNRRINKKVVQNGGIYHLIIDKIDVSEDIKSKFNSINSEQHKLFSDLISFIQEKKRVELTEDQKTAIQENFYEFILDNGYSDEYSNYISAFVIKNDGNSHFKDLLSSIREGLVLYDGIRYTPDLNELGKWKNKLTIYLSTEYLFNSQGLNGEIFQEIFYDFYDLVREINLSSKSDEKIIELRYFSSTKNEINKFFGTAELIKSGRLALNISRPAMANIVKNAKEISDIALRKADFFRSLTSLGIYEDDYECSIHELNKYNLEDKSVLEEISKKSLENGKEYNENDTLYLINIFTKINSLRRGVSDVGFEKIGFIYITDTSYARYLGHSNLLKISDGDFAYCKEMDFLTTKFWFHLNKGFAKNQKLPKAFDLINKAKIIISSHLVNSVSEKYDEFVLKIKSGQMDEERIKAFNYELKSKVANPEKIDIEMIDNSLAFLEDEHYLTSFYNEIISKEVKLSEQEKELSHYREKEKNEKEKNEIKKYKEKQNVYALERYDVERAVQNNAVSYFFKSLIPEFLIVLISVVLFRIESFQDFLKEVSDNYSFIFWVIIIVVVLTANYIKSNFIDKDKVKKGWSIIKRPVSYLSKKDKDVMIANYKKEYKEDTV